MAIIRHSQRKHSAKNVETARLSPIDNRREFVVATGGNQVTTVYENGIAFNYHVFLSSNNFTVTGLSGDLPNHLEIFLVAGGGSGGHRHGGGGGGGGVIQANLLASAGTFLVTVGAGGGPGSMLNGSNTTFGNTLLVAVGGGGGYGPLAAQAGGSGGGGGYGSGAGGTGYRMMVTDSKLGNVLLIQGYQGSPAPSGGAGQPGIGSYPGLGGGGAGGNSGVGLSLFTTSGGQGFAPNFANLSYGQLSGNLRYFGGGGGGGHYTIGQPAVPTYTSAGGVGGGGTGGFATPTSAGNGTVNTGGGGGGWGNGPTPSSPVTGLAGTGGSGIAIIKYKAL